MIGVIMVAAAIRIFRTGFNYSGEIVQADRNEQGPEVLIRIMESSTFRPRIIGGSTVFQCLVSYIISLYYYVDII